MHVGFYHDTSPLSEWDWQAVLDGQVALSGTDGQTLRLAHELADASSVEVTLLTPNPGTTPSATLASQVAVDTFPEAVHHAHAHQLDVLVFVNAQRPEIPEGVARAEALRQPCIAWCKNGPWRPLRSLYATTDAIRRVICVTRPHADIFRDKTVFSKIEVIPNGIDAEWYRPAPDTSPDPNRVCYVGALTPDKGFHHLAQVWPSVRQSTPSARLTVVGSARLYDRSETLGPLNVARPEYEHTQIVPFLGSTRAEARHRHGVDFRGLTPPRSLRTIMQNSSLGVVNPNLTIGNSLETFCVSAVEFQAAETAVIGARRRGLRETVQHEETGLLINSQRELESALSRLLNQPEEARRMGKQGQRWVTETFDFSTVVQRWHRVLDAIVQGKPPDPPAFSLRRATPKTMLREGIRRFHSMGAANRLSLLDDLIGMIRDSR